jgi:biopolymer transport protein ExbB/TolQ
MKLAGEHKHPWGWPLFVGIIVLWLATMWAIARVDALSERCGKLEQHWINTETRLQHAERQLAAPKPDRSIVLARRLAAAEKLLQSAHRRADQLADVLDALCHHWPGRAHCPRLLDESRKR